MSVSSQRLLSRPRTLLFAAAWLGLTGASASALANSAVPHNAADSNVADLATRPLSHAIPPLGAQPVHIAVTLATRHSAALDQLIAEQRRPGSPAFRQFLTPEHFADRFAPTADAAERVANHLRQQGFVNVATSKDHMLITADGTVTTLSQAFDQTPLGIRPSNTSTLSTNQRLGLSGGLSGLIASIQRTDSTAGFHVMAEPANRRLGADPSPAAFHPLEFPAVYGVGNTPDGRNTTVGIIAAGELSEMFDDYETAQEDFPLPRIPMEVVRRGDEVDDEIGIAQWDIDSQVIQSMAGGYLANMIFYDAPTLSNADITTAISDAVNDGRAKIINISLGQCERAARDSGTIAGLDPILQAGASQGIVFSVAAGNIGGHGCRYQQSYPATSPYVVAVGGTTLKANSAGGYFTETAWRHTRGGYSQYIDRPSYQDGIVGNAGRGVPDIALDADPATGAVIIYDDDPMQYGGTGLSAALFTGMYARIESATGNAHDLPTPSFYETFPAQPGLTHDITEGRNVRYNAGPGWDPVTGFGSPIIQPLADYVSAHPDF